MLATDTDSVGVLWAVGGLSPLRCWNRHPGVKTGMDHYDLQSLNIYLTLGSGWLIPLGLVIADCSWGCLMGLWWLMPNGIRVWAESIGSIVDRLCLLVFLSISIILFKNRCGILSQFVLPHLVSIQILVI